MFALDLLKFLVSIGARKFIYPNNGTALAGRTTPFNVTVQNDADFLCLAVTMAFPTVLAGVDDGVNRLSATFSDGASQLPLSNDFVDLVTIAAPGRQRLVGVAGDPSNALNIPGYPWLHLYEGNGAIQMQVNNDSDTDIILKTSWDGYKVPFQFRELVKGMLNPLGANQ
jgi:hypothetical protein